MIVIGEKINGTLPMVKTAIQNRDRERLLDLAKQQAGAGASYIDINVGLGLALGRTKFKQWNGPLKLFRVRWKYL